MQIHGRAKLGPAGRLALTQAVMDGMTLKQAAACLLQRVAGDSPPVVASPAKGHLGGARFGRLALRSLKPSSSQPAAARGTGSRAHL